MGVGQQNRLILIGAENWIVQKVIEWLGLNIIVKDISPQISSEDFEEMMALYELEYDERPVEDK
jgi:hypothetical protein